MAGELTGVIFDPAKLRAFVIGPIGDRDAHVGSHAQLSYESGIEIFEYVIAPACDALNLDSIRADQISRAGEINEQIFRLLRDSHVVIADLTDANPNVMYELGLRHTTGKLTVQIGERGRLPFDISTIRTILFKRTEAGLISARRSLIAALATGIEQGADPVTATRVWYEDLIINPADGAGETTLDDSDEAPGFLEDLVEMDSGLADMSQTIVRASGIIEELGEILADGVRRINELPSSANYSAKKLALVNQIAISLQDSSVKFKIVAQDYRNHVDRATPGVIFLLQRAAEDPRQLSAAPDFLESFYAFIRTAEESASASAELAETIEQAGNPSRMLKRINDSIRGSAISMAMTSRKIADWKALADQVKSEL